ncbi:recombinase family protein [Halogranum rubrum]|nr:recombinase family protein [Halogranum rubrum]
MAFGPHQATLGEGHQSSFDRYDDDSEKNEASSEGDVESQPSDDQCEPEPETVVEQSVNDRVMDGQTQCASESEESAREYLDAQNVTVEDSGKRGVIYARVSTAEQAKDGDSLETQVKKLVVRAREDGVTLIRDPITEDGETGTDFDRSGIKEVFELAQTGKITHLYVNEISRIGRNAAETLYFVYLLQSKFDITLIMGTKNVDITGKISDLINTTLEALMAQVSMEARVTRSTETMVRKFEEKISWQSVRPNIPIGYQAIEHESGDNWIETDSNQVEVVKRMYEIFLEEKTYSTTGEILSEEYPEIPTFDGGQVKRRLKKPLHIGKPTMELETDRVERDKVVVDSPELAVVDESVFREANEIIEEISKKSSSSNQSMNPFNFADKFGIDCLYSSAPRIEIVCPNCESTELRKYGTRETGEFTVHNYECKECSHQSKWPNQSSLERMRRAQRN